MRDKGVFELVLLSSLCCILVVLEYALSFLPNIQVTVLLIVLYSKELKTKKTLLILLIYVLLDNLLMGSMNLFFIIFMFAGWALVPLLLNSCFKKVEKPIYLALLGVLFSFLYSWIMVVPSMILFETSFFQYMCADIVFECLLALSSFLTICWLYQPLKKALKRIIGKENEDGSI